MLTLIAFGLNVSPLFRTMRATCIASASVRFATGGEVVCRVDGIVKRREQCGVSTFNTAKETFTDMLCAECPFLAAWRKDELHAVSLTYDML